MKKIFTLIFVIMIFMFGCSSNPRNNQKASSEYSNVFILNQKTMDIIDESVFEVVMLKPKVDSLEYEKDLPMSNIPFSIRNDSYYSIGTAFAISENDFVTAAHVFFLEKETQFGKFFIRDRKGNVSEIDLIKKYSNDKDFCVFNLKDKTVKNFLKINRKFNLNQAVFAVGNAFGQGIISRNGVLTSATAEEENGEWDWIRFSAAASPGNSGGPLLDKDGKVIGVIVRKSQNENLNYALPISELMVFEQNKLKIHSKMNFGLLNFNKNKPVVYNYKTKLPKKFYDLQYELVTEFDKYSNKIFNEYLDENRKDMFPNGKGSYKILYGNYQSDFPTLISQNKDGFWDIFKSGKIKNVELEKNGKIEYGAMNDLTFLSLKKPDNMKLIDLYTDSKLMMDTILKGIFISRNIGNEEVRITSMGKAKEEYDFIDRFQRKWLVKKWTSEYNDVKIISFSLPVPEGIASFIMMGASHEIDHNYIYDLKEITNFIHLSYYGSFKNYKEYLKLKDFIPENFKEIKFTYENNKSFSFEYKNLLINLENDEFSIEEDSDILLNTKYSLNNEKINWEISGVTIGEDKNKNNYFYLEKVLKPVGDVSDQFLSEWEKTYKKEHPYNGKSYSYKGETIVSSLASKYLLLSEEELKDKEYIYVLSVNKEGEIEKKDMIERLDRINKKIIIK